MTEEKAELEKVMVMMVFENRQFYSSLLASQSLIEKNMKEDERGAQKEVDDENKTFKRDICRLFD